GGERISRGALEAHGRWLDAQAYAVACRDLTWNLLMRGYCAEALSWTQRAIGRHEVSSGQASDLSADVGALLTILGRRTEARDHIRRTDRAIEDRAGEGWQRAHG